MQSGESKIYKHPKAATLYVTIPSDVVKDSKFSFKAGDRVAVRISEDHLGMLEILKATDMRR